MDLANQHQLEIPNRQREIKTKQLAGSKEQPQRRKAMLLGPKQEERAVAGFEADEFSVYESALHVGECSFRREREKN